MTHSQLHHPNPTPAGVTGENHKLAVPLCRQPSWSETVTQQFLLLGRKGDLMHLVGLDSKVILNLWVATPLGVAYQVFTIHHNRKITVME